MMRQRRLVPRPLALSAFATAAIFGSALILGSIYTLEHGRPRQLRALLEDLSRRTSIGLPGGKCRVTTAVASKKRVEPVFAASYPGSGAKMTWNLVEGLTGITTGDEHGLNGNTVGTAVTVKTHFPHNQGSPEVGRTDKATFPRAILILRHPKDAISSYHNYLFEQEKSLPGHSTRAPLDEWSKWRDANFDDEIRKWKEHTEYWMERYAGPEEHLVLSFEGLTDRVGGPIYAKGLAKFLNLTDGVETVPLENVRCIWENVIQYEEEAPEGSSELDESTEDNVQSDTVGPVSFEVPRSDPSRPQSRRSGSRFHPYTVEQLDRMLAAVTALQETYVDVHLYQILQSYAKTIEGEKLFGFDLLSF